MHQPGEEIAYITAALFVPVSEDCRDKSCTSFAQLQIFSDDPLNGAGGKSTLDGDLLQGYPVVSCYKVFNSPYVPLRSP